MPSRISVASADFLNLNRCPVNMRLLSSSAADGADQGRRWEPSTGCPATPGPTPPREGLLIGVIEQYEGRFHNEEIHRTA